MKSLLRNGKIPTPPSIPWAKNRSKLLAREIENIANQLADVNRPALYEPDGSFYGKTFTDGTPVSYPVWKRKAVAASTLFVEEKRQTDEWLAEHTADEDLLRESLRILEGLAQDIDNDLNQEEEAHLQQLRRRLA